MKRTLFKTLAMTLAVIMLVSVFTLGASAAWNYQENATNDTYYKLISQKYWQIAPGIEETEVVLNNDGGSRRQVVHSVSVDLDNPYNDIIPGYTGMAEAVHNKEFRVGVVSEQARSAERLGYGNVVAATNTTLSWYTEQYYKDHPEYVGEPLGYSIVDGDYYANSNGPTYGMSRNGSDGVLIINYDEHPITGEPRPDSIPKVMMRTLADPLTGWEKNAIPAWAWLVKPDANGNPVNQYASINHTSGIASRTFVGIKADGTVVLSVSDGEQLPYSAGFTMYEMADYMIKMGCIYACNMDGGGSTTFCTKRPGEDLKVNCSLSDGGERPTTSSALIISNAPADGQLAQATVSADYDFYTPGSTVNFSAIGTDVSGATVDIPDDVQWQIKEDGMGTINGGVFTSNGTEGTVTAQMVYNGTVVGEKAVTIATPDGISMSQSVVTVPFGKTAAIPIVATVNNGLHQIGLGPNDISFNLDNTALGTFDGMSFSAVDEADAPANLSGNVTATLNMGSNPTLSFELKIGKGSEVMFDFEDGQSDVDIWNVIDNRKGTIWDYDMQLSLADKNNGQVHDGNYSMRLELNGLSSNLSHSSEYGWIRLGIDGDAIELQNARSLGFWMYIPDDCIQLWAQGNYMADTDGNGTYDTQVLISMPPAFPNQVYDTIDEPGWHYLEMDLSQYESIALKDTMQFVKDPSTGASGAKGDFFISFIFARAKNNPILDGKTVIGPYTFYLDNFTVDYSDATDDRENPVIEKIYMDGAAMEKREVVTTDSSTVSFTSNVADATARIDANKVEHPLVNISGINASSAKAYVDGVQVDASYANGVMSTGDITVADGYHRIKFEICDNVGNKSVMIRQFKVESGSDASTVKLVPADATLDRILFGSVYWMNLVADDIEKIQSVETVIDMNSVNHWQLDHMILAEGFTADYTIDEETNTAAITFTRTEDTAQTGEANIAQIPVRILDYDNDIHVPGKTAAQYWANHEFWGHDLALDVDKGLITFVDETTGTFSNEEFRVQTEMYTSRNYMDAEYLTTHGSTHIHTPEAIADKAPTCTEEGYTGRTFCNECNSVVDWGTTVPATGHSYVADVKERKLVCESCGKECTDSGIIEGADGKIYYAITGKLLNGWQQEGDDWYFFDLYTFDGVDGRITTDKGIAFDFDNGRVMHGEWETVGNNKRYWFGPGFYKDTSPELTSCRPYEIDGETYLFDHNGYMQTGIHRFLDGTFDMIYFDCGTDGKAVRYTGVYSGTTFPADVDRVFVNGYPVKKYKLIEVNGDFYFINDGFKIAKNRNLYLSETLIDGCKYPDGRAILPGVYSFGEDGKMVIEPEKNGVIGGKLYIKDVLQTRYKLVQYDDEYYFVNDGDLVAVDKRLYLAAQYVDGKKDRYGYDLLPGNYYFGSDGKMVQEPPKNGVVDGKLYIENVLQKRYQLAQYGEDFYFVNDGDLVAVDKRLYLAAQYVDGKKDKYGYDLQPGYYNFDADGKMIQEAPKDGVVDGKLYIENVLQKRYQLAQYGEDFYFINDGDLVVTDKKLYLGDQYVSGKKDKYGYDLLPGYYNFDADGKMIQEAPKNGVVDGKLYIDNVLQKKYALYQFGEDYYFVNDGDLVATSKKLYLGAQYVDGKQDKYGYDLLPGYYNFDAEGKMIQEAPKNGVVDGKLYIDNILQTRYKLVQFDGSYYFINDGDLVAKNVRMYLGQQFVAGHTLPNGDPMPVGYYQFDADGKMIIA